MEKNFRIAVLIDGDNAQPKLIKQILEEVAKYGKATIRRIYGDWTTQQMNVWKDIVNENSFNPIQKFSYTTGKNSTDSALIIDAMDILHGRHVDGFCIVSSDSDYTGLAKRIREGGVFVMGIGRKITPVAFVQSCEIFTYTENITGEIAAAVPHPTNEFSPQKGTGKNQQIKQKAVVKQKTSVEKDIIDRAFEISVAEDEQVYISQMGINLRKIDPSFDTRAFGYKTLTQLFENLPGYEVIKKDIDGSVHSVIKKR
jgi:uncharacterized LabA/DUF88 family protein